MPCNEMEKGRGQDLSPSHGIMVRLEEHISKNTDVSSSDTLFIPSASFASPSLFSATSSASSPDAAPIFLSQQLPYAYLLDTLPYVDALSPEQHEAARLLVQQEMAAIREEKTKIKSTRQQHLNNSALQQQNKDGVGDNESGSGTPLSREAHNFDNATAAAKEKICAFNKQQKPGGEDNDANADEQRLLNSYLSTFPLPETPHLDSTDTLAGRELARLARGETFQTLDFSRYEALPTPPAAGNKAQESEWRKSVDTCEGLLEHLGAGQTNLELMNLHAVSVWMRHLHGLMLAEQHWTEAAKRLRNDVDRVSKQRKLDQVECSTSLRDTARMREDYERRNEEILAALGKLQEEVVELRLRCQDRGVLPDDYDSDFEEELEDWEALASTALPADSPPAPALEYSSTSSSSTENTNSNINTSTNANSISNNSFLPSPTSSNSSSSGNTRSSSSSTNSSSNTLVATM